ncbi:MAG: phosphoribosylformylglycinamidine synthase subunit PurQ, partial [Oscillospiraceae bacterium]|nr:phosphoribosylformylglycinamidine synthase subunit PurQ [Oscillospiraceae bacterium]
AKLDFQELKRRAEAENIEVPAAARVTERKRLVMLWREQKIVDLDRAFLDTNGAERHADVYVPVPNGDRGAAAGEPEPSLRERLLALCGDLNFCSRKGLVERFDSSIGAGSVFEPFGGRYALTETQVMAALLPAPGALTASVMACGCDPRLTEADPFGGAVYAVVSSVARLVASGVSPDTVHLSLQEYFPRVHDDPARWGPPFAAMLGAFSAQMGLEIAAIGGKDSMSGSFGDLDVPPTLISFAAGTGKASDLISPEFKAAGHPVYLLETPLDSAGLPDYAPLRALWERYTALCRSGKVLSAWVCEEGGVYGGLLKMALGNGIGFSGGADGGFFGHRWASIVFEAGEELEGFRLLGYTRAEAALAFGEASVPLAELRAAWESPLESVFPTRAEQPGAAPLIRDERRPALYTGAAFARPRAVIPVFPGTNCEYDTAAAIERAGGIAETVLVRNLTPDMLRESAAVLEKAIASAQILVFPGGFSGGDEPDGSGKFIVSLFRGGRLSAAVHELLHHRDGLILGICNGFQALIKLGLLPHGRVTPMTAACPTLTFNRIGRHQSRYIAARVSSVLSPWLSRCEPGDIYVQPVSHGEGRLTAPEDVLEAWRANGQIAFQYADDTGAPSMDIAHNPNGSDWAVEGISSPDGRVLGKMAHAERQGPLVAKNIPGVQYLPLFEGGAGYFR